MAKWKHLFGVIVLACTFIFFLFSARITSGEFFDFEEAGERGLSDSFFVSDGFYSFERDVTERDPEVYEISETGGEKSLTFKNIRSLTYRNYGFYPMSRFIPFERSVELSFRAKIDSAFENDNMNAVLLFYGDDYWPVQTQEIGFRNNEVFLPHGATGVTVAPSIEDAGEGWKKITARIDIDREALPDVKRLTVAFVPNLDGAEPDPEGTLLIDDINIVVS